MPSPLVDRVNGRRVSVRINAESYSASVVDENGRPIPSVTAFWFAWYPFHPNTQVFTAP
jgi:hypothetical protein